MLADLVTDARRGDRDAFEALVRGCSNRLYAVAYRILRDPDLAEDALQAALIAMRDDLGSLRDPERFDAWTYRLLCRACYRLTRNERRRRLLPSLAAARWQADEPDPAASVADHDELECAFRTLTPEHRAVLVLHHHVGLTIGETAEVLGVSPGTVGSRLHYALRDLRAALASEARALAWEHPT